MRLLVVVLVACNGKDDSATDDPPDTDTDTDTDSDTDADTDADTDSDTDADTDTDTLPTGDTSAETLPDPYAGLVVDECEGGLVQNVYTTWFVGDYTVSGATFTGTETGAVHWSPEFVSECAYAADCRMVWTITGDIGQPGACGSCDYSMTVSATLDQSLTDCPPDRWADVAPTVWATSYDVKLVPDGTSEVYFSGSGNPFGGGHWLGDRVTYVATDALCFPYPDDISGFCP